MIRMRMLCVLLGILLSCSAHCPALAQMEAYYNDVWPHVGTDRTKEAVNFKSIAAFYKKRREEYSARIKWLEAILKQTNPPPMPAFAVLVKDESDTIKGKLNLLTLTESRSVGLEAKRNMPMSGPIIAKAEIVETANDAIKNLAPLGKSGGKAVDYGSRLYDALRQQEQFEQLYVDGKISASEYYSKTQDVVKGAENFADSVGDLATDYYTWFVDTIGQLANSPISGSDLYKVFDSSIPAKNQPGIMKERQKYYGRPNQPQEGEIVWDSNNRCYGYENGDWYFCKDTDWYKAGSYSLAPATILAKLKTKQTDEQKAVSEAIRVNESANDAMISGNDIDSLAGKEAELAAIMPTLEQNIPTFAAVFTTYMRVGTRIETLKQVRDEKDIQNHLSNIDEYYRGDAEYLAITDPALRTKFAAARKDAYGKPLRNTYGAVATELNEIAKIAQSAEAENRSYPASLNQLIANAFETEKDRSIKRAEKFKEWFKKHQEEVRKHGEREYARIHKAINEILNAHRKYARYLEDWLDAYKGVEEYQKSNDVELTPKQKKLKQQSIEAITAKLALQKGQDEQKREKAIRDNLKTLPKPPLPMPPPIPKPSPVPKPPIPPPNVPKPPKPPIPPPKPPKPMPPTPLPTPH